MTGYQNREINIQNFVKAPGNPRKFSELNIYEVIKVIFVSKQAYQYQPRAKIGNLSNLDGMNSR